MFVRTRTKNDSSQHSRLLDVSTNSTPVTESSSNAIAVATFAALLAKHPPESESLVTGSSHNSGSIRTSAQIKHTESMTSETDDLLHLGILPHHDLILAVAVSADDLVTVLTPREIADLASRVDFLDQ